MELRSLQALQYVMCFRKRYNNRWHTNMTFAFIITCKSIKSLI